MHAAGRGESHKMESLAVLFGVVVGADDFGIFEDRAVGTGTIDFHKVLIDDASGTDVEVSHFRVTHLSVGQTNVFTAGKQLRVRIFFVQTVDKGCRRLEDNVAFAVRTVTPAVETH